MKVRDRSFRTAVKVVTRSVLVPLVVAALVLEATPAFAETAPASVTPSGTVETTAAVTATSTVAVTATPTVAADIATSTAAAPAPVLAPPAPVAVPAVWFVPVVSAAGLKTNKVSWYGPRFYGHTMAGGGNLRPTSMVLAHRSLPFGTKVLVVYKGRAVVAVVNDRGPYVRGRNWDLGPGVAKALRFGGVAKVGFKVVSRDMPIGPVVLAAGYPRIAGVTTAKAKKAPRRHAHRRSRRRHG